MSHSIRRRSGFSVTETMIMALCGILLFIVIMGMVRASRWQDEWNAGRLDGVTAAVVTLERVRQDAWVSREVATVGEGGALRFAVHGDSTTEPTRTVDYGWAGPGQPLMRNGKPIATARLQGFGVTSGERLTTIEVLSGQASDQRLRGPRPRPTQVTMALYLRESALRARYPQWVGHRLEPEPAQ